MKTNLIGSLRSTSFAQKCSKRRSRCQTCSTQKPKSRRPVEANTATKKHLFADGTQPMQDDAADEKESRLYQCVCQQVGEHSSYRKRPLNSECHEHKTSMGDRRKSQHALEVMLCITHEATNHYRRGAEGEQD